MMDRAGAGSAGPGSRSRPGHSPLSCSLPFLVAAVLPIVVAAPRVLTVPERAGRRRRPLGLASLAARRDPRPALSSASPPGNLSPSLLLLSGTPPQSAAHWPGPP